MTTSWTLPFWSVLRVPSEARTTGVSSSARVPASGAIARAATSKPASSTRPFNPNHDARQPEKSGATTETARGASRNGGGYLVLVDAEDSHHLRLPRLVGSSSGAA